MINFFLYCIKKWVFQAHRRVPPTTGVVELGKKTILQWKPMELGGVPQKLMSIFTGNLYSMYVVLQGVGSLPFQGIYHIRNSLWGVATLDVWSS